MDLKHILANSELKLHQQFDLTNLENIDLSKVTKQELLDVILKSARRIYILENLNKELFKEKL